MKTIFLFVIVYAGIVFPQVSAEWTSFFTGPGNVPETIEDVFYDNSGNAYLTGSGYFTQGGQGIDFLTVKCNTAGEEEWAEVYNGVYNNTDRPRAIFADNSGNVYTAGTSQFSSSRQKIIVIKYSSEGDMLWTAVYDSAGLTTGEAIAVTADNTGNVYVTGLASRLDNSYYDFFVYKIDTDGNFVDSAYYNQVTNTSGQGTIITADNNGNVYAGGNNFNSTNGEEVVIIKYNNNLDTAWTVHVNGSDNSLNEFAIDLQVDDNSNVYALCRIQNDTSSTDYAVVKINSDGEIVWRTEFDANTGQDIPSDMVVDESGNIFVTGRARLAGYNDFAIVKYNNDGEQQWVSYYDGPNNLDDDPTAITLDTEGNIYVCGESNREGSHFKFIVVKYNPAGDYQWEYVYDINESSIAHNVWADVTSGVYAAGEGIGTNNNQDFMAVKLDVSTGVTSENNELPSSFYLGQNYPNPFNPSTTISYAVSSRQHVVITIVDLLGNEIAEIVNEEKSPGYYETSFNATGLSSGVYFYSLNAGSFSATKKLIVLK